MIVGMMKSNNMALLVVAVGCLTALGLLVNSGRSSATGVQSGAMFDAIDQFVLTEMNGAAIPGIAVAVVEGDRIVHARGYGHNGHGQAITPQTPFWIGSNTKSFTALATMQLVEAGRIDLDSPVRRYLPEFQVADSDAAERMTIRHLLNQTSGFSRALGLVPVMDQDDRTLGEAVAGLRSVDLNRQVGDRYEYSNLNFMVLGLVVERLSNQSWEDYVRSRILHPLEMSNSVTTQAEAREKGLTSVHQLAFGIPIRTAGSLSPSLKPTGGLYGSAEDLAHYLALYLLRGSFGGQRLLSAEGIDAMLRPATNITTRTLLSQPLTFQYGRGWFVGPFGTASDARWHLGELPYFASWLVLLPESNQGVVVLINANSQFEIGGVNSVMSRIPIGVVNILRGAAPPTGPAMTPFYLTFDLFVMAFTGAQVWSLAKLVRSAPHAGTLGKVPLTWELGLSLAVLSGVPTITGVNWIHLFQSIPDLSLVLGTSALLWLATGVTRSIRLISERRFVRQR